MKSELNRKSFSVHSWLAEFSCDLVWKQGASWIDFVRWGLLGASGYVNNCYTHLFGRWSSVSGKPKTWRIHSNTAQSVQSNSIGIGTVQMFESNDNSSWSNFDADAVLFITQFNGAIISFGDWSMVDSVLVLINILCGCLSIQVKTLFSKYLNWFDIAEAVWMSSDDEFKEVQSIAS